MRGQPPVPVEDWQRRFSGAWGEHYWHSWAAIAKHRYYILSHGQDTNYTGVEADFNYISGLTVAPEAELRTVSKVHKRRKSA